MNPRIRELAISSGIYDSLCDPYDSHNTGDAYGSVMDDLEKFAELIVRECISCVGSQSDKAYLKKRFDLPVESDILHPATEELTHLAQYKRKYNLPKIIAQEYFVNESGLKVNAVTGDLVND